MKTFVTALVIAAVSSTASFAAVGDMVSNGYGKTLEVTMQSTGSSGNTIVKLLNDKGETRKFTVKANGKVKGKGGKRLKANIAKMVAADNNPDDVKHNTGKYVSPGKGMNLVDCSLTESGVDRVIEISHNTIKKGIKAQRDWIEIACAE